MASCEYGVPSDDTLRWFLLDRKLDVDETVTKLNNMMKWRKEFKCVPQPGGVSWPIIHKVMG